MTTYAINTEKNGIEITFETIPSEITRATLKAQGWRWSRFGGFWYNRNTPENEQTARDLADGKTPTPAQYKNAPATKKSPFTDEKPADKYAADVIGYVKLSSGDFIPFEKSKIKTYLCFGYDELCAETVEQASRNRNAACEQYEYFERLQCQEIDNDIERITRAIKAREQAAADHAAGQCAFCSMRDLVFTARNEYRGDKIAIWRTWNPNNEPADKALQIDDLRAILDGLQAQKEYKQRQARTYWKRFGGSKLHAWTYSVND